MFSLNFFKFFDHVCECYFKFSVQGSSGKFSLENISIGLVGFIKNAVKTFHIICVCDDLGMRTSSVGCVYGMRFWAAFLDSRLGFALLFSKFE